LTRSARKVPALKVFMALLIYLAFLPSLAGAFDLTVATFTTRFSHSGPGLLLQHLQKADDGQVEQEIAAIVAMKADVLLLTNFDYDYDGLALSALQGRLRDKGLIYDDALGLRPNTGIPTWLDLNHDGALSGPRDAQAYGRFAGQAGMAILSRYPIDRAHIRDFTGFLWKDLPDADLPPDMDQDARLLQRLSNAGHYEVPVTYAQGKALRLLVWSATPPLFDGPEDRNGRRNADETALWLHLLDGTLPKIAPETGLYAPPEAPFVILGQANLDPVDGSGRPQSLRALLNNPLLQDPTPRGPASHSDAGQRGDPALDTTVLKSGAGLRLDYLLPSRSITVQTAGVLWPMHRPPLADGEVASTQHFPVWARLTLP
jgi:hypothetical protein